jgi:hypothetical protein
MSVQAIQDVHVNRWEFTLHSWVHLIKDWAECKLLKAKLSTQVVLKVITTYVPSMVPMYKSNLWLHLDRCGRP